MKIRRNSLLIIDLLTSLSRSCLDRFSSLSKRRASYPGRSNSSEASVRRYNLRHRVMFKPVTVINRIDVFFSYIGFNIDFEFSGTDRKSLDKGGEEKEGQT